MSLGSCLVESRGDTNELNPGVHLRVLSTVVYNPTLAGLLTLLWQHVTHPGGVAQMSQPWMVVDGEAVWLREGCISMLTRQCRLSSHSECRCCLVTFNLIP